MPERQLPASGGRRWPPLLLKLLLIGTFVAVTNYGCSERVSLLVENSRWFTLSCFVGIWALGLVSLLVAALQPRLLVRSLWALLLAASGAVGYGFFIASRSDLTVLDVISLWTARHET